MFHHNTLVTLGLAALAGLTYGQQPTLTPEQQPLQSRLRPRTGSPGREWTAPQVIGPHGIVGNSFNFGGIPNQAAPVSLVVSQGQTVALCGVASDATSADLATFQSGGVRIGTAGLALFGVRATPLRRKTS